MSKHIQPNDYITGTWQRVRAELLGKLWMARAMLEKEEAPDKAAELRARIKLVKELLEGDTRKHEWSLQQIANACAVTKFPVLDNEYPEDMQADTRPPVLDHDF